MNNLKKIRTACKLSQSELAKESGVSLKAIQTYESGQRDINKANGIVLYKLSKALNCAIEDILNIERIEENMSELSREEWSKAIITAQEKEDTMLPLDTINHVIYIKNHGLKSITEDDLKHIDKLYPFLPTEEQTKVRDYIKAKFDLVDKA